MRKTESKMITVKLGRFNEPTREVTLDEESTVGDALSALEIVPNDSETLWVEGIKAENKDVLEDGDRVVIVPKKDGGDDDEAPAPEAEIDPKEDEDKEEAPAPEKE